MIHHITRATRHLIFWTLIVVAVGITGIRLALHRIEHYKADLTTYVSDLIGAPITIGHIHAGVRGFSPELVLHDIGLAATTANKKPAIQLQQIRLGINLLEVARHQALLSSTWVTLVGARLTVKRKIDGRLSIVGLNSNEESQPLWLLQGRKYEVLQSQLTWQDEKMPGHTITLDAVDLVVMNDGDWHRINLLSYLPKTYGYLLRLSADFNGNISEPGRFQGKVFVEGKQLKLAPWFSSLLPGTWQVMTGSGDFSIWGHMQQSQWSSVQGDIQLQNLKVQGKNKTDFFAKQLNIPFYAEVAKQQWSVVVNDMLLQTRDNISSQSIAALKLTGEASTTRELAVSASQVDLQSIAKLMQVFAPLSEPQYRTLVQSKMSGQLNQVALLAKLPEKLCALASNFSHVTVIAPSAQLSVENISGRLKGNLKQGELHFATNAGRFTATKLFRQPLVIDTLSGALTWQQAKSQWVLSSSHLTVDTPAIKSKSRFQIRLSKLGEPAFWDLQTHFMGHDVSQVKHYLPVGIMRNTLVNWLDKAFIKGRVPQGDLLFYGKASDFPFTQGQGVFEIFFDVEQLTLDYHPKWPMLSDMVAKVLFLKNTVEVDISQAQSEHLKIMPTQVKIPDLQHNQQLLVEGSLSGDISQGLAFMQKTPLSSKVQSVLANITPSGNTQVALVLNIPLVGEAIAKVDGNVRLQNAKLKVNRLNLPVNQITGDLQFNEQGLYSKIIHAEALHYPIQISLEQLNQKTVVNVAGRLNLDDWQAQIPALWQDKLSGAANYKLKLDLFADRPAELNIQSDLVGITLKLPDGLAKNKAEKKPLFLTFTLDNQNFLPINIRYANQLKAMLELDVMKKNLASGDIVLGLGEPKVTEPAGLTITLNHERLVLQDWLAMVEAQREHSVKTDEIKSADNIAVKTITAHTAHALWQGIDLGFLDLTLKQEIGHWAGEISSAIAKGQFYIPMHLQGLDKIRLTMNQVDFSVLKQQKWLQPVLSTPLSIEKVPEIMPLLAITSKESLWQGIDLGYLTIETGRKLDGINVKRMALISKEHNLTLTGDWKITGKQSQTVLNGHWDVPKAGEFFRQIGLTKDFSETQAKIDFALNWKAAPQQLALAKLQGQMDVHLTNGRILSIEPGFGRMLGVLALAQWIKRLQLDFSDVYAEGLTFNRIDGHFDIVNGKLLTKNLVIDAIPATITLTGETDLVKKTVNYIVNVVPKSADAVPIAGTIVGRVTAQVMKSLTGKELDGFLFGSQYQIKGRWGSAQLSRLYKNDGLLQKTWHGITDFSWLRN